MRLLDLDDIVAAAARIEGKAFVTPLMTSPILDRAAEARILIKPECLQRTGSFKFRGAYNRIAQFNADEREAGIVAWSSGNHAQAIAAAAQLFGTRAAIVMPRDAPAVKRDKTLAYGAEIIAYDRNSEDREEIGRRLAQERGAVLVPSYDDYDIMAGQGTVGLEVIAQAGAAGCDLDLMLVCCGGGGLTAGIATAIAALSPATEVIAVEPEGHDDYARSLAQGKRVRNAPGTRSICDALLAETPGELTFAINQRLLAGAVTVSDAQVREAMAFAFAELKLVVEPGGAVALAAVLFDRVNVKGRAVGVVLSGGNIDTHAFLRTIGSAE